MPRDADRSDEDPVDVERRALEAARTALYRPGADDAARRSYAELAERIAARRAPAPSGTAIAAPRRRSARLALIGGTAVIAAVLTIALVLPRSDAVRMTPMRFVGATDPAAEEAAVLSLFAGSFAARNSLALRAAVDPPPALSLGGVQRAAVREIDGTGVLVVPQRTPSGTVTVVVLCTSATAFRWSLTVPRRKSSRVLATSSSTTCLGTASYATVSVDAERRTMLRFSAAHGSGALVALVVVPDVP